MISLESVEYRYGGLIALRDVSLELSTGITYIVGPNAAGKTTLLKIAACIYRPHKGRVIVNGVDYWSIDKKGRPKIRRKIVYVHEKPILIRGTVIDNIIYPLIIRGWGRRAAEEEAVKLLYSSGLGDIADRTRGQLSAGQAQILSILRAIIIRPKYLLLDEPTNMLDLENRDKVIDMLKKITGDTTIVIATHDLLLPMQLPGRIIAMRDGRIVGELSPIEYKAMILERLSQ